MPNFLRPTLFPRHIAILILLAVGTCFASAHIAARISFDNNTGLLTAVLVRSAVTVMVLTVVLIWRRQAILIAKSSVGWQLLLGLLIACQSVSIYSSVSRVPVGIGLLVVNTFPVWLALITWALGGRRPSLRVSIIMGGVVMGLLLALDLPARLAEPSGDLHQWLIGIAFALLASISFAFGLWIIEHKLPTVNGTVRSLYTMVTVFVCAIIAGKVGLILGE
ncbi:EamA/RhaT family transporter [Paenalcaligenes niemegkensis]|uniref:EamA family transporter n=1 Tax=Paenalcaligenes niemegkensis TaxID=2895469 RepID=UPI001EE7FBA9|nr:EamA family transporter [Paenalcaligenes niemegkensis]MCQ9615369.1 EamA/RhaT family transporter [Paenalcaligenes niemegkensis]